MWTMKLSSIFSYEPKVGFVYVVNSQYRWFNRDDEFVIGRLARLDIVVPEGSTLTLLNVEPPPKFGHEDEKNWWYTFLFGDKKVVFITSDPTYFSVAFTLIDGQQQ